MFGSELQNGSVLARELDLADLGGHLAVSIDRNVHEDLDGRSAIGADGVDMLHSRDGITALAVIGKLIAHVLRLRDYVLLSARARAPSVEIDMRDVTVLV